MSVEENPVPERYIHEEEAELVRTNPDEECWKAVKHSLDQMVGANSVADFLKWQRAALWSAPEMSSWIWQYNPSSTAQDVLSNFDHEGADQEFAREARFVEELQGKIETLPEQEGMVRVALKRTRDEFNRYTYRVLAAFPEGARVHEQVADKVRGQMPRAAADVIYFDPENACVDHACDDLYKLHRGESAFYVPNRTIYEALAGLQGASSGATEYQLDKTTDGATKQDAENYVMVGLLGGYSNERLRVRISDFWARESTE